MIPRHGRPPRPGIAYRHRPGAYAILIRHGRLLLTVQRTRGVPEVQLPGGGLDSGESPIPALLREIGEETGYTAVIDRRLGAFRDFTWMPEYRLHAEKICHVYLGRPGLRLGPPSEAGHSVLWLAPGAALGQIVSAGSRAALARLLARHPRIGRDGRPR